MSHAHDELLAELRQLVDRGELAQAASIAGELRRKLTETSRQVDHETLRSAAQEVAVLTERVCVLRSDLKRQLGTSRRKRQGAQAYQTCPL